MAQKLQFLNEYGELNTFYPGYCAKSFEETLEKSIGCRGIVESNFIINFHIFWFFGVGGDFEISIAVYQ